MRGWHFRGSFPIESSKCKTGELSVGVVRLQLNCHGASSYRSGITAGVVYSPKRRCKAAVDDIMYVASSVFARIRPGLIGFQRSSPFPFRNAPPLDVRSVGGVQYQS
jgi:hypothetical protein